MMRKIENKQKSRLRNTRVKDKKHDYDKQWYDMEDKDKKHNSQDYDKIP
jgi:hypothetical protein